MESASGFLQPMVYKKLFVYEITIFTCVSFLLQTFSGISLYSKKSRFIAWRIEMKIRYFVAASVAALIAAGSAKAADIIHYQEAAVPVFS